MRSYKNTILIAAIAAVMPFSATFSNASPEPERVSDQVVRKDRTKADLVTPADRNDKDAYDRIVMLNNGMYAVTITDAAGNLRMKGTFADEELKVPHGEFTYYYPNGNIESSGRFENGVKSGIWNRYAEDGSPKAERVYTGMTWDDMAVMLGVPAQ